VKGFFAEVAVGKTEHVVLHTDYAALASELAATRAVLGELQWSYPWGIQEEPACPVCMLRKSKGHATNCKLAAALSAAKETT
jgi:hypothetical protein